MNSIIWGLIALLASFIVACLCGAPIIKKLKEASFGQEIREIGPSWHKKKSGTPTMGAFIFDAGFIPVLVIVMLLSRTFNASDLSVIVSAVLFGIVGFSDDYIKVIKKRNLGLTAGKKFAVQALVSAAFALYLYFAEGGRVMLFSGTPDFSYFVIPFNIFVMLATVNAVNLTDGIDGLAGSTTVITMLFFAFAAYIMDAPLLLIIMAAVAGGVLGFLMYNKNPAKVFMGDTGSLFLGGLIGAAACRLGLQFIIILTGLVYFIETVSVIMQVTYFKATHGKRIFLMTPIHHHFEKKGWSEKKIVAVASSITLIMSVLSGVIVFLNK